MPYNKLKPNPTPMVGIGKGHVHLIVLPGCKIFYLDDGNRSYCEDWNHIDIISRCDGPHVTEDPPPSPPGIDFLGRHKILFADNFAISGIGTAKNRTPILNAKG